MDFTAELEIEKLERVQDEYGRILEEDAQRMDEMAEEFSDNPEIAAQFKALADNARNDDE